MARPEKQEAERSAGYDLATELLKAEREGGEGK
jgi:hypothetical protein